MPPARPRTASGSLVPALSDDQRGITLNRRTALVDEAKVLYTQYPDTRPEPVPLLDFVGERLGAEPEVSDVVRDLLAFLAVRMIEINIEKYILSYTLKKSLQKLTAGRV